MLWLQERDQTSLPKGDDPKNAAALEQLEAKLARHQREAEMLAAAMRQKPMKR